MGLVDARINIALDSSVSGSTHYQLHTADPGAAGTSNVASGITRQAVSWAAATALAKVGTATFTIPAAGGPYTHVSFWNASSAGTYYGFATVTPAEAFAAAGVLAVTVTVSAQSS